MIEFYTREMEKQVGYRVQTILGDPLLLGIFDTFGAEIFRRSSVFHGLGKFLAEQEIRGERCFEIGTWNGLTAAVLSRHFDEVVTVDIAHNAIKHEIFAYAEIKNVRCIDIGSNEEKARIASELTFDFAYLDGNHAKDTEADLAMTKKAGRVLFHEAWPFQEKVWKTVHQLPHTEVVFGGAGLALWRRSDPV